MRNGILTDLGGVSLEHETGYWAVSRWKGIMGPLHGTVTPDRVSIPTPDPTWRGDRTDDARACRLIAKKHARTFSIAGRLLPERKRRAAYAIYATCRTADDIVDGSLRAEDGRRELRLFRDSAFAALERRSDVPLLRELARAVHEFDVPVDALAELFDGLERDLGDQAYNSWPDLEAYCQGVAGSVGEMCCAVFGIADDLGSRAPSVVASGRTLGVAMQLTNVLRDVGEDAARGRCYLPALELARFGLTREAVLAGNVRRQWDSWQALLAFQVARARDLYRQALPDIHRLQLDSRRCALACASGYSRILDAVEDAGYDTISSRVSVSRLTLLGVAWRSWRGDLATLTGELAAALNRAPMTP